MDHSLLLMNLASSLKDIHDLVIIGEHKDEPTISFEDMRKRLKRDGLI